MRPLAAMSAAILAAWLSPALALAAEVKAIDPDFLEFLGSVDSEGEGWAEFLGNTDLDRPAPKPKPPARKAPPSATPAPPPVQPPVKGAEK